MKTLKFGAVLVVLFQVSMCFGQQPYYDALRLREMLVPDGNKLVFAFSTETEKEELARILGNYLPGSPAEFSNNDVVKVFLKNPFLKDFINPSTLQSNNPLEKAGSIVSAVSGLNVATIADGLAKFLVVRVKEELSITFFSRFKEDLQDYPDLQTLFPSTYAWLKAIDTEAYNYTSYLSMLREAFIKDFQVIIPHLKAVVNDPRHDAYFKSNPPLRSLFLFALDITEGLQHGEHPGDILHTLAARDFAELDSLEPNIKPAFKTVDLIIQSLRSKDPVRYMVPFDSIRQNLFKEATFRIYLGLIYQQSDGIVFQTRNNTKRSLKEVLDEVAASVQKFRDFKKQYEQEVREVTSRAEVVQQALAKIKEQNQTPGTKATYNEYYQFYDATLNLIEYVSNMPHLVDFNWSTNKDMYFFVARKLGDIYLDVNEKKYSAVVLNLAILYDTIRNRPAKDNTNNREVFSKLLKVGNFAATVASAENSDQVKEAIEAVALPAGSARIKRESYLNVSLNAYVGLFAGNESMPALKPDKNAFTAGLFAPVGVAFSRGGLKKNTDKGGKSISAFVSLIDVGALAAFRFANDSAAVASEIELKNILSPGLFAVWGLGRSPISIGAGVQVGPRLREVNMTGISVNDDFYVRTHLFIAVDIPVINLYNRRKD